MVAGFSESHDRAKRQFDVGHVVVLYVVNMEKLLPERSQTDPSGPPLCDTREEAGARELRVGLVVLWDVVHLRQVLEVDGDDRLAVVGQL